MPERTIEIEGQTLTFDPEKLSMALITGIAPTGEVIGEDEKLMMGGFLLVHFRTSEYRTDDEVGVPDHLREYVHEMETWVKAPERTAKDIVNMLADIGKQVTAPYDGQHR